MTNCIQDIVPMGPARSQAARTIIAAGGAPAVMQAMIRAILRDRGSETVDVSRSDALRLGDLPPDAWVVLDGDDPAVRRQAATCRAKIVWVGRGIDCDIAATHIRSSDGRLKFDVGGQPFDVPIWGRHHVSAALAAIAVGWLRGLSWEETATGLARFVAPPGHCEVFPAAGATIIDDTCDETHPGMCAALELLREVPWSGRRIVVCDDGDPATTLAGDYRQRGEEFVVRCGADLLVTCGGQANDVRSGALEAGMPPNRIAACRTAGEAVAHLRRMIRAGDAVLVQGARAAQIVDQLRSAGRRQAA